MVFSNSDERVAIDCKVLSLFELDPIEIRLKNYAERDEHDNLPWSSKELRAAIGSAQSGSTGRAATLSRVRCTTVTSSWNTAWLPRSFLPCALLFLLDNPIRRRHGTGAYGSVRYGAWQLYINDTSGS
jgi:hypothetical protein